jgi:hypothetical protein
MQIEFVRERDFMATDAEGNTHHIELIQEFVHGENGTVTGLRYLRTSDGRCVQRRAKGEYILATRGVVIQSEDPACP